MVLESVINHGAVEGGVCTLVRAVSHLLEPLTAQFQSILIELPGTEDIHFQMEPFLAALICHHQYGIAVSILLGIIIQSHGIALGFRA